MHLHLEEYTFQEHDETIAYSLSIPFASTLVFASIMKHQDAPGTTFKRHMAIAHGLMSEDDYLLSEILFNPNTPHQLEQIQEKLSQLQEIVKNRWYDKKEIINNEEIFYYNQWKFSSFPKKNNYSCYIYKYNNISNYTNELTKISKDEFLTYLKNIPEFTSYSLYKEEIEYINQHDGEFYLLENQAVVCVEKRSTSFAYISYLGVFKNSRKTNASTRLMDSLKAYSVSNNVDLYVIVENDKVAKYYEKHNFIKLEENSIIE